ncbi:MAG: alpha/beta hydrolase [Pseudomonadota bacterium]
MNVQPQQEEINAPSPVPEPASSGFETTPDGYNIRFAVFRAKKRPNQGTILLLHGRNEAIEKYTETIADFLARGFDVGTFDWRGQGYSDRLIANPRPGYVDSYEQYAGDFEYLFKTIFLPETRAPFFVVAHSMGALAALVAAPILANRVRRMVLSAPLLGLGAGTPSPSVLEPAMRAMCFVGLSRLPLGGANTGIAYTPFLENKLTTDLQRYTTNQALAAPGGPLSVGPPTCGWMKATFDAINMVHEPDHMARIHTPTLILTAGSDTVVSSLTATQYARNLRSGAHIAIDGAKHELMQEADRYRDQFFAAFGKFIPGTTV